MTDTLNSVVRREVELREMISDAPSYIYTYIHVYIHTHMKTQRHISITK